MSDLVTEADAMDEAQFWTLVEQSLREHPDDCRSQVSALRSAVEALPVEEHCGFCLRFEMLDAQASAREHLWAAAYIIRGGCSDDSWMDFRAALLSRGRALFEAAVRDPDSLADLELGDWVVTGAFFGLDQSYEERTGKRLPHWGEDVRQRLIANIPADDPQWDDDEDLPRCCPRLCARYWRR